MSLSLWCMASLAALLPLLFVQEPNASRAQASFALQHPSIRNCCRTWNSDKQTQRHDRHRTLQSRLGNRCQRSARTENPTRNHSGTIQWQQQTDPHTGGCLRKSQRRRVWKLNLCARVRLKQLRKVLVSIQNEVQYSNTIIDMILTNTADKPIGAPDSTTFSVQGVLKRRLHDIRSTTSDEKQLVKIQN